MDKKKNIVIKLEGRSGEIVKKISKATNQPIEKVVMFALGTYAWALREISLGAKIGAVTKIEDGQDAVQFIDLGLVDKEIMEEIFTETGVKTFN